MREDTSKALILKLLLAFFFLFYNFLTLNMFFAGKVGVHDLGELSTLLYNSAHGEIITYNRVFYLLLHLRPTPILLWSLPYSLVPYPLFALFLVTLFLWASGVIMAKICAKLELSFINTLLCTAAFYLNPYTIRLLYSVHYETLVVFFSFVSFYFFFTQKYWAFFLAVLATLGVRQDVPIYLSLLSCFLIAVYKKNNLRYSMTMLMMNVIYFIIAQPVLTWIANLYGAKNYIFTVYPYGNSLRAILLFLVSHPLFMFQRIWSKQLLFVLASTGFIQTFVPVSWIFIILACSVILLAGPDRLDMHNFWHYHSFSFMPLLFISAALSIRRAQDRLSHFWIMLVLVSGIVIVNINSRETDRIHFYPLDYRIISAMRLFDNLIPHDSSVSAQFYPFVWLRSRSHMYTLHHYAKADYVVIDKHGFHLPDVDLQKIETDNSYTPIAEIDGIVVYKRRTALESSHPLGDVSVKGQQA